jgi:hypothetical protein
MPRAPKKILRYKILGDSSEKKGWSFNETEFRLGMEVANLPIADYTIEGIQDLFLIERKKSPSEWYQNLMTVDYRRFHKELVELDKVQHAYIIWEFSFDDLVGFPWNEPKIPKRARYKIAKRKDEFLTKTLSFCDKFPNITIIPAGRSYGKVAASLFDKMVKLYPKKVLIYE